MIVKLFNMVDLVIRFLPERECSARKSQFWTEERRPLGYVYTVPGQYENKSHKIDDFGAISVTERSSAAPISKVERHISDSGAV